MQAITTVVSISPIQSFRSARRCSRPGGHLLLFDPATATNATYYNKLDFNSNTCPGSPSTHASLGLLLNRLSPP
jgi:hypothetical protein